MGCLRGRPLLPCSFTLLEMFISRPAVCSSRADLCSLPLDFDCDFITRLKPRSEFDEDWAVIIAAGWGELAVDEDFDRSLPWVL
jgi:hypothetical protein